MKMLLSSSIESCSRFIDDKNMKERENRVEKKWGNDI